jgi:hypothetical protein
MVTGIGGSPTLTVIVSRTLTLTTVNATTTVKGIGTVNETAKGILTPSATLTAIATAICATTWTIWTWTQRPEARKMHPLYEAPMIHHRSRASMDQTIARPTRPNRGEHSPAPLPRCRG